MAELLCDMTDAQANTLLGCPNLLAETDLATQVCKKRKRQEKTFSVIPKQCAAVLRLPDQAVATDMEVELMAKQLQEIVPEDFTLIHAALENPTSVGGFNVLLPWLTLALNHLVVCYYVRTLDLADRVPNNSEFCAIPCELKDPTSAALRWEHPPSTCRNDICVKRADKVMVLCGEPADIARNCKTKANYPCPAWISSCGPHANNFKPCDEANLPFVHEPPFKGSYGKNISSKEPENKKPKTEFLYDCGYRGEKLVRNPWLVVTADEAYKMKECEKGCPFCKAGLLVLKNIKKNRRGTPTALGGHALLARRMGFAKESQSLAHYHYTCTVRAPGRTSPPEHYDGQLEKCSTAIALGDRPLVTWEHLDLLQKKIDSLVPTFAAHANKKWEAHKKNPVATTEKDVLKAFQQFWEQVEYNGSEMRLLLEQYRRLLEQYRR